MVCVLPPSSPIITTIMTTLPTLCDSQLHRALLSYSSFLWLRNRTEFWLYFWATCSLLQSAHSSTLCSLVNIWWFLQKVKKKLKLCRRLQWWWKRIIFFCSRRWKLWMPCDCLFSSTSHTSHPTGASAPRPALSPRTPPPPPAVNKLQPASLFKAPAGRTSLLLIIIHNTTLTSFIFLIKLRDWAPHPPAKRREVLAAKLAAAVSLGK